MLYLGDQDLHVHFSCLFATGTLRNHESSVDVIRLDVSRTFPHLGIFQKVNF